MIKPIIFNTEMVRAILDERKSVTRRVLKIPRYIKKQDNGLYTLYAEGTCYENQHLEDIVNYITPPCQSGDILYVRETWNTSCANCEKDCPAACSAPQYRYKADIKKRTKDKWRPSIHMPKEAARIFLRVTNVRVEKLQDMNGQDVLKEGVNSLVHPNAFYFDMNQLKMFSRLWNSTLKKDNLDLYGWDANPWVWVIEFERCEKPEEWGEET